MTKYETVSSKVDDFVKLRLNLYIVIFVYK